MTRVVLLTADGLRHRYVACQLHRQLGLAGIVSESKPGGQSGTQHELVSDTLAAHFRQRDVAERDLLEKAEFPSELPCLRIESGQINSAAVYEWTRSLRPDILVLYGTGIVRSPLLAIYHDRTINMHLGLSPYYRGSATNFWPLVDGVPECIGVTIHLAVPEVDAGPILAQVRPQLNAGDRIHEIGTKALMAGTVLLAEAVPAYVKGRVQTRAQARGIGRLCRRRDFNPEAVRRAWKNLDEGMIPAYLTERRRRDARYPLVQGIAAA